MRKIKTLFVREVVTLTKVYKLMLIMPNYIE